MHDIEPLPERKKTSLPVFTKIAGSPTQTPFKQKKIVASCAFTKICQRKSLVQLSSNFAYELIDIDECAEDETNDCDSNALCTNNEGSYVCRCKGGYSGDGKNCSGKEDFAAFKVVLTNSLSKAADIETRAN